MAKTLKKLFDWDEYGRKVLSGEIVVCKQIKQGVQKHYADLKASPENGFVFSEERAQYAIQSFLFVKHSKGKFAGQQFVPSLWQQFWVAVAFGPINIANPKLKDINYTCKFRQRDGIEKILHTIQKIHHFKIEIDKENNVITLK